MPSDLNAFTCIRCSAVFLSYILGTGTGRTDGRNVYGVASRVFFTDVFGEGTQLSRRRMVTYCPNVRHEGGVAKSFLVVRARR